MYIIIYNICGTVSSIFKKREVNTNSFNVFYVFLKEGLLCEKNSHYREAVFKFKENFPHLHAPGFLSIYTFMS